MNEFLFKQPDTIPAPFSVEEVQDDQYAKVWNNLEKERLEIDPNHEKVDQLQSEILREDKVFLLSKEDFESDFLLDEDIPLRQGNTGNCYLVSALYSMNNHEVFEIACRHSVKKNPDGSWDIKVPFLHSNESSQWVHIEKEELQSEKVGLFSRNFWKGRIPFRRRLDPLQGKIGLQALEAAYTKAEFGELDRVQAEGGLPETVAQSLFGNVVAQDHEEWDFQYESKDQQESYEARIDHFLTHFEPKEYVQCSASSIKPADQISPIIPNHAYSVVQTDIETQKVVLKNPHDTSVEITLSFDEFKSAFSHVNFSVINNKVLLNKLREVKGMVPKK